MDTIEFFRQLITDARQQTDAPMQDTTVEQFNWAPPGTASPISAIFIHLLNAEDFFLQNIIQGKPLLWEESGWGDKTGVKNRPGYGGNWDEFKQMTVSMEPVMAYQRVVHAATDAFLEKLTPGELERKVKFAGGERTVASILIQTACHSLGHAGEIAILKGIQGVKGLPY